MITETKISVIHTNINTPSNPRDTLYRAKAIAMNPPTSARLPDAMLATAAPVVDGPLVAVLVAEPEDPPVVADGLRVVKRVTLLFEAPPAVVELAVVVAFLITRLEEEVIVLLMAELVEFADVGAAEEVVLPVTVEVLLPLEVELSVAEEDVPPVIVNGSDHWNVTPVESESRVILIP